MSAPTRFNYHILKNSFVFIIERSLLMRGILWRIHIWKCRGQEQEFCSMESKVMCNVRWYKGKSLKSSLWLVRTPIVIASMSSLIKFSRTKFDHLSLNCVQYKLNQAKNSRSNHYSRFFFIKELSTQLIFRPCLHFRESNYEIQYTFFVVFLSYHSDTIQ